MAMLFSQTACASLQICIIQMDYVRCFVSPDKKQFGRKPSDKKLHNQVEIPSFFFKVMADTMDEMVETLISGGVLSRVFNF